MKKTTKFLSLAFTALVLSSCQELNLTSTTISQISSESSNIAVDNSSKSSSSSSESSTTTSEFSTTTETKTTSENISSSSSSSSSYTSTTDYTNIDLLDKTIKSDEIGDNSYSTGNYGYSSKTNLTYYRTTSPSGCLVKLLKNPSFSINPHPSCIANKDPYNGIRQIEMTYSSDSDAYLLASLDKSYSEKYDIKRSSTFTTITLRISPASYFKICSTSSDFTINKLTIKYDNVTEVDKTELTYSDLRINMSDFYDTYTPTPGVVRKAPSKLNINDDGTYSVSEYKEYTYATSDWARSQSNPDQYAYTDPVDVANYYMLFHTWPANYGTKKGVKQLKNIFTSNKVRQVSEYSRQNGYATAVPYFYKDNFVYYELDIDVSGTYSTGSRGTGRLVVWNTGFNATNYDENPVIVFTDDHYATFKEFLNYSTFGERFNVEQAITSYSWCLNKTLKK